VNRCVIERVHRLKILTVEVKAGRAVRRYRVVKSDAPNDLVSGVCRSSSWLTSLAETSKAAPSINPGLFGDCEIGELCAFLPRIERG
jgi:hypothetical protein